MTINLLRQDTNAGPLDRIGLRTRDLIQFEGRFLLGPAGTSPSHPRWISGGRLPTAERRLPRLW